MTTVARGSRNVVIGAMLAVVAALFSVAPEAEAQTIVATDAQVAARNDDAEERANGTVSRGSSDIELLFDAGGHQTVGLRFAAVAVPNGATVTSAHVQFTADETNTGTASITIAGEASDAATQYSSSSLNISSRPTTSAAVAWSPPDWTTVGAAGPDQQTPDIAPVIQEIVDRAGWAQNNPLALIITGSGERTAESFDGNAAAAARLHIEYETSGVAISDFSAAPPNPLVDEPVVFSWSVSDSNGDPVTCTLDVDDDGTAEYTIPDCAAAGSQSHVYGAVGSNTARLVATSSGGNSNEATTVVTVADPSALTFEQRISAGSDDAEEAANGNVGVNSSDIELVAESSNQTVGLRFASVDVPPGATITNAHVQFTTDEVSSGAASLTIRGQAADAASQFTSAAFSISSRPTTSASTAWSPPAWSTVGQAGPDQRTPDISPIIQQIVNRGGWAQSNPLALIITGTGRRTAESFNGDSSAAALLHIDYTLTGVNISSFAATPSDPLVGDDVEFSWSVTDAEGGPVSCTLDVDDDGTPEYTLPDCIAVTSQTHAYGSAGSRTARLVATGGGDTAEAVVDVTVTDPAAVVFEFEQRVGAGNDDAEEAASGPVSRSSSDLEFVFDRGGNQTVGMRFVNVDIPPAATITAAWIQLTADETHADPTTLTIRGEASDNAPAFSSTAFDISSRPTTSASAIWSPPPWNTVGQAGSAQRTADISPIVQEIVDRIGWDSGSALSIVVTGTGERTAESFNGDASAAPLLHVEYQQDIDITSFTHGPTNPGPGDTVTFDWSVTHRKGDPVSCTLDVDDDGTAEYSLPDCIGTTSQTHTYPTEGYMTARLVATDGVATARSSTLVNVIDPQTAVVAAAGDIACDPTSSYFNGGAGASGNCLMQATSDLVLGMSPHAVLVLGDNQYEDGTYQQFMQSYDLSWGRFKDITYPSVGNHEYKDPDAAGYYTYFGAAAGDPAKGYYSVEIGNWHVIALNSNCSKAGGCSAGTPQEQWLRADLAAHPAACTLAIWHHPLFSSGAIGNISWTQDLWQALDEAGAEIVLVGHDHHYERFGLQDANGNADPTGIREFVVGTGGRNHTSVTSIQPNSEAVNDDTYGVLKLTLRPTSYEWEFVPEPGESFTDTGSQDCG